MERADLRIREAEGVGESVSRAFELQHTADTAVAYRHRSVRRGLRIQLPGDWFGKARAERAPANRALETDERPL